MIRRVVSAPANLALLCHKKSTLLNSADSRCILCENATRMNDECHSRLHDGSNVADQCVAIDRTTDYNQVRFSCLKHMQNVKKRCRINFRFTHRVASLALRSETILVWYTETIKLAVDDVTNILISGDNVGVALQLLIKYFFCAMISRAWKECCWQDTLFIVATRVINGFLVHFVTHVLVDICQNTQAMHTM